MIDIQTISHILPPCCQRHYCTSSSYMMCAATCWPNLLLRHFMAKQKVKACFNNVKDVVNTFER